MHNLGVIGSGSRMTELVRKMIAYPDIRLAAKHSAQDFKFYDI